MLSNNYYKYGPFWLLTLALIIGLVFSQLIQEGCFMDGLLYVAVSKNLSLGHGTFWEPYFSDTFMPQFHEQPPLYFGLLASFYKVFGGSIYIERFFCAVCLFLNAIYIHKIWQLLFKDTITIAKHSWLPIICWITIPVCFWAYTNQVEETVMSVFTLASVYYCFRALINEKRTITYVFIAGVLIFLASLTKGVQGFFPLVTFGIYWLCSQKISFTKMLSLTMMLCAVPVLIYSLLLFNPIVFESIKSYFEVRLVRTFNNVGATTDTHFYLLWALFQELLPILILTAIILIAKKRKSASNLHQPIQTSFILSFIGIGLAGALPLMVTLEQRNFYLVTSFPFFAIAFSLLIITHIDGWISNIKRSTQKTLLIISSVLLACSLLITVTQIGSYKRDELLLKDIKIISHSLPPSTSLLSMPIDMANDWNTICYFMRYSQISLTPTDTLPNYYIIKKSLPTTLVPKSYELSDIKTQELSLYLKKQ